MRCDTREELAEEFIPGNNFSISINTNNKEETDRLSCPKPLFAIEINF